VVEAPIQIFDRAAQQGGLSSPVELTRELMPGPLLSAGPGDRMGGRV